MSVSDIYAFSVVAALAFEIVKVCADTGEKIGIGVMAPASQDCGKNLIKILWQGLGFSVVDIGTKAKPNVFLNAINEHGLKAIGISCMDHSISST